MSSAVDTVKEYLEGRPLLLNATSLTEAKRVSLFVLLTKVNDGINLDNPAYRDMRDVVARTIEIINDFRTEIQNLVELNLSDVLVTEVFSYGLVNEEFAKIDLYDYEQCRNYLLELAEVTTTALDYNLELQNEIAVTLKSILYLCVISVNAMDKVYSNPTTFNRVGINFIAIDPFSGGGR